MMFCDLLVAIVGNIRFLYKDYVCTGEVGFIQSSFVALDAPSNIQRERIVIGSVLLL